MKTPVFFKISWEMLEKDCLLLAKKIENLPKSKQIDQIIAISRGGLVWARVLSDLLKIPISHMTIESYKNLRQQKKAMISEAPAHSFEGKSILIVDEIADSGKTLKRARSYFQNFALAKVYLLAPYIKSHTKVPLDFFARKIDGWIIFPYELRETFDAFVKLYKSKKKAHGQMLKVGFKKWQLENL